MRATLIIAAVVVALFLAALVAGRLLPVRHRAAREATYRVDAGRLYALLTTPADYPQWRSGIRRVEMLPAPGEAMRFRESSGDGDIVYSLARTVPGREVVTRIEDKNLPYGGGWTLVLTAAGDSTTLRITEEGEIYSALYRFVSRFIIGHHAGIDRYLRDVGRRFGERAEPRAVAS